MKTAATTATGTILFSGIASANFPDEIRFCGCDEVCVVSDDPNKTFYIVIACPEEDGGFNFFKIQRERQQNCPNSDQDGLCFELDGIRRTGCSGEGNLIEAAVVGHSTGDESAENDDNLVDANVQSESDHSSDCDTIDADAGTHDTNGDADNDTIDGDAGTTNTAGTDDDTIDGDAGTTNTAVEDNDTIDGDAVSDNEAESDRDDLDVDVQSDSGVSEDSTTTTLQERDDACMIVAVAFDQDGDGKLDENEEAINEDEDGFYCNPNSCAKAALEAAETLDRFNCDLKESGTHKNNSITIKTGNCNLNGMCSSSASTAGSSSASESSFAKLRRLVE